MNFRSSERSKTLMYNRAEHGYIKSYSELENYNIRKVCANLVI